MEPASDQHPLTHIRRAQGWGKAELARKMQRQGARMGIPLATDRTTVWKWETQGKAPDIHAQRVLAALLATPPAALAAGWPAWLPAWEVPGLVQPWTPAGAVNVLTHLTRSGHMDRRGFISITGSALTGIAVSWAAAGSATAAATEEDTARLNHGGAVDAATLDALERRVDTLRALDDATGGSRTLALATSDLDAVTGMLAERRYTTPVGRQLHALAAQIAFLAGWMAHDTGLRSQGQLYCSAALRSARAANDDTLGAYILAEMSVMSAEAGQVTEGATMAETAASRAPASSSATLRSYLTLQQASAYARAGDRPRAAHALNTAHAHWDHHDPTAPVPPWLAWYGTGQLSSSEARVLHRSGDYLRAVRALENSVATSAPRDQAVRSGRLASVHLDAGNLDGALAAAGHSLDLLEGPVYSSRARNHLDDFAARLGGQRGNDVRDFTERLTELPAA